MLAVRSSASFARRRSCSHINAQLAASKTKLANSAGRVNGNLKAGLLMNIDSDTSLLIHANNGPTLSM